MLLLPGTRGWPSRGPRGEISRRSGRWADMLRSEAPDREDRDGSTQPFRAGLSVDTGMGLGQTPRLLGKCRSVADLCSRLASDSVTAGWPTRPPACPVQLQSEVLPPTMLDLGVEWRKSPVERTLCLREGCRMRKRESRISPTRKQKIAFTPLLSRIAILVHSNGAGARHGESRGPSPDPGTTRSVATMGRSGCFPEESGRASGLLQGGNRPHRRRREACRKS
jgi:hypothetical protein